MMMEAGTCKLKSNERKRFLMLKKMLALLSEFIQKIVPPAYPELTRRRDPYSDIDEIKFTKEPKAFHFKDDL